MVARRLVSAILACACVTVSGLVFAGVPARAAVTHKFLRQITQVPAEGPPPAKEQVPLPGPLFVANSITVDSGHVWVAERTQTNSNRVDEFDATTGAFLFQFPQPMPVLGERGVGWGIAVRHPVGEADQVYVGSSGIVDVFNTTGGPLATWTGEHSPGGSFGGGLAGGSVALDSSASPTDWAKGDVLVINGGQGAVDVFAPAPDGVEPSAPVTQLSGTCEPVGTTCPGSAVPFAAPSAIAVDEFNGDVLVVDDERVVDVFEPTGLGGYRFVRQITETPKSGTFELVTNVAADSTNGDIYVSEGQSKQSIQQFDAAGNYLDSLRGTPNEPFSLKTGVAVDPANHDVYIGNLAETTANGNTESRGMIDVFSGNIIFPDVSTESSTGVTPTSVILDGTVGLAKEGVASCEFVWGTTRSFGHVAACEPSNVTEEAAPVHANLTGLEPDTTYYYRLQASNKNGTNPGEESEDGSFSTLGPGLDGEWSSGVSSTSATLGARVNPDNVSTTVYFEYDTRAYAPGEAGHGTRIPVPAENIGSGESEVQVEKHLQGLIAGTTYHFRVVAVRDLKGGLETFYGVDRSFVTQSAGSASVLPDGRAWELVSPPDKQGALILPISEAGTIQASASGGAMTYLANKPTEMGVQGYFDEVQVFSDRGSGGWSSRDISLPHKVATGFSIGNGQEYRLFSEDLSLGLIEPIGEYTSLSPEASPPDTERTLYLRHDQSCENDPASCFQPLVTGAPGYADVPEGTQFGGSPTERSTSEAHFAGGSPDLSHVILESGVALTSTPAVPNALYEWSAGEPPARELGLVSVLPASEGGTVTAATFGAFNLNISQDANARHAVSDDGSRVFWTAGSTLVKHLYVRDMRKSETVRLDVVQVGASGEGVDEPRFQTASADGSRVFFTDEQQLTVGSGAASKQDDLYECAIVETAGKDQCDLTDLTPPPAGESAGVQSLVVGASNDGSYVYFVGSGVLTDSPGVNGEHAVTGASNLYMLHEGAGTWEAPVLIGVLSGDDAPDWGTGYSLLARQAARVSPNGRFVAFMSDRSLTGYDNHDANSGMPDEEVFLFDADSKHLACASCDPTGGRPIGEEYQKLAEGAALVSGNEVWENGVWLAANVPGWTPFQLRAALYQSRYLSDQGRLFFNSDSALVPQDINNNQDVYEYEPAGIGDCSSSSAAFSDQSGGCVGLVSSGTAAGESGFLDASENGNDVFFLTGERLTNEDVDTALDVYDAHACTSGAPCVAGTVSPPACTTADACRAAPSPQPGVFGAPSSATFVGAGNVSQAPGPVVKTRSLTRAQKLSRTLKACRKKSKRKRIGCEREARKRFGAKQPAKTITKRKSKGKG